MQIVLKKPNELTYCRKPELCFYTFDSEEEFCKYLNENYSIDDFKTEDGFEFGYVEKDIQPSEGWLRPYSIDTSIKFCENLREFTTLEYCKDCNESGAYCCDKVIDGTGSFNCNTCGKLKIINSNKDIIRCIKLKNGCLDYNDLKEIL